MSNIAQQLRILSVPKAEYEKFRDLGYTVLDVENLETENSQLKEQVEKLEEKFNGAMEANGELGRSLIVVELKPYCWKLDPDPYGYHNIPLDVRLHEMGLLPECLK